MDKRLKLRVAIITVSDRSAEGSREDLSGPAAREELTGILSGHDVAFDIKVVPDDAKQLREALAGFVKNGYDFVFTTGGTGIGSRDVTPEVTKGIVEKELPGIGEAMHSFSMGITKNAMLSRATAGLSGESLIINLPGSPTAVREILNFLGDTLEHAHHMIHDIDVH